MSLRFPHNLFNLLTSGEWLHKRDKLRSTRAIFIVGCPHSGTSIMHRLIGYHSGVFQVPQETYWFSNNTIRTTAKREILSIINIMHLFHAEALLEKTPSHHNCLDLIQSTFAEAKIVFMLRDPRDVCASMKARGIDLFAACSEWNMAATNLLNKTDHRSIMSVRLEDFLHDPESKLSQIQQFCGLDSEDLLSRHGINPKRFYAAKLYRPNTFEDGINHNANRNWQINQPLFYNTNRWMNDLNEDEISLVKRETLSFAQQLSYSLI